MIIDEKLIDDLAALLYIDLDKEEKEQAKTDLNNILEYMNRMNELDTNHIELEFHNIPISNVLREDIREDGLDRGCILANALEKKDGFFIVSNKSGA